MSHPSRRKGDRFEYEVVHDFQAAGIDARRAFGSNGESLTTADGERCNSDVDVLVAGRIRAQLKRRRSIASYLQPPPDVDIAVVREDRGESLVVMRLRDFMRLLHAAIAAEEFE